MRRLSGAKMTPEQLAKFLGIHLATVYRWANGETLPNMDPVRMSRLCVALECHSIFELAKIFQADAPNQFQLVEELLEFKSDQQK